MLSTIVGQAPYENIFKMAIASSIMPNDELNLTHHFSSCDEKILVIFHFCIYHQQFMSVYLQSSISQWTKARQFTLHRRRNYWRKFSGITPNKVHFCFFLTLTKRWANQKKRRIKRILEDEKAGDVPHSICERKAYRLDRKSEIKVRNKKK